jgi:hypothetical protein
MLPLLRNLVAVASLQFSIRAYIPMLHMVRACRLYIAATENIFLLKFPYIIIVMTHVHTYYFPKFCKIYIPHDIYRFTTREKRQGYGSLNTGKVQ